MKRLVTASVVGTLLAASTGGCGASPSAPSTPLTVTVTHSPAAGATVTSGSSYEVRVDHSGGGGGPLYNAVAFVRDDGVYSVALMCGDSGGGGGTGSFSARQPYTNNPADPLNFAAGRRVNLVVLFSSRSFCGALGAGAPPVDPSQADLGRTDVAVNWLIGG